MIDESRRRGGGWDAWRAVRRGCQYPRIIP
jgi:hypothetical protein